MRLPRHVCLLLLALPFAAPIASPGGDDTSPTALDRARKVEREAAGGGLRARQRLEFERQQLPPEVLSPMAIAPCVGGLAGTYPCDDVDLMAFLPLSAIGGGNGNDIWGWTDSLTGREYALMGRTGGTSFVDITDPVNPVYLGDLPTHSFTSSWRDIKVYADHAFVVSEATNHGMQVFDLTQLRSVTAPPVTFTETAHYDDFSRAHNLVINEDTGFAYAVGTGTCSGGPHFVDISDPTVPVYAGCFSEDSYTHDAQCVIYQGLDTDYQGQEICFNSNETAVTIVDVTNKSAPVLISRTSYPNWRYTHQGWLTEDHRYLPVNDELDEQNDGHNTRTRVFDVADLDAPVLVGFQDGVTTAIDHNLYTHQGYVYEANYRAGLRILDLADVAAASLTEVAFFDIYPSSNSPNFNGAWSVYPFFPSGNVIVSGIEQGLFVLRPNLQPGFSLTTEGPELSICDPGSGELGLALGALGGYSGSVTLSAIGLPSGASDGYDVNPAPVPGAALLTVSVSSVPDGTYPFTVRADDGAIVREVAVDLRVSSTAPAMPQNLDPADGALDVSRTPRLSWDPVQDADGYTVELAADASFDPVLYAAEVTGEFHQPAIELDSSAAYVWRVRPHNACGDGSESAPAGFTTLDIPPILLVDDDDNGPDVQGSYLTVLSDLGRAFDVWDTGNTDAEPSAAALAPYEVVIWFTGDEFGGASGPGAGGEAALATWLDSSRCLLIASQDYYYDRSLTAFMQQRLGVAAVDNDVSQSTATGAGSVFAGIGPYTLDFPYTNFTDRITPDGSAEVSFDGSAGTLAVNRDAGFWRTSYWGYGLETVAAGVPRREALDRFLQWCDTLPLADGDADLVSNGQDCAPGDASVWGPPSAASGLLGVYGNPDTWTWTAPAQPGGTAVVYDLLRTTVASDLSAGTCAVADVSSTSADDAGRPGPGELWFYVVRARNGCGSNAGADSGGGSRSGGGCN